MIRCTVNGFPLNGRTLGSHPEHKLVEVRLRVEKIGLKLRPGLLRTDFLRYSLEKFLKTRF